MRLVVVWLVVGLLSAVRHALAVRRAVMLRRRHHNRQHVHHAVGADEHAAGRLLHVRRQAHHAAALLQRHHVAAARHEAHLVLLLAAELPRVLLHALTRRELLLHLGVHYLTADARHGHEVRSVVHAWLLQALHVWLVLLEVRDELALGHGLEAQRLAVGLLPHRWHGQGLPVPALRRRAGLHLVGAHAHAERVAGVHLLLLRGHAHGHHHLLRLHVDGHALLVQIHEPVQGKS